jgi:uncharacterized protein with PIN domain
MALSREQMEALLRSLSLTRQEEITCDECLKEVAEFAENELQGKTVPESLEAVAQHLLLCGECREEYEALLRALGDAG